MRNFFGILFLTAAVALAAVSCAKRVANDDSIYEKLAFEAWMDANGPADAIPQPNGMYVQFLEAGDTDDDEGATADEDVWVRLNYTSTTLSRDVYATRSESEALRQGIYTPHTYYAPDYLFCGSQNAGMIEGRYYALKRELNKTADGNTKTKLYKGSKVKLFMPSTLAYGTSGYSDDQGYGGQYALNKNRPIIETFEIVEVVKDPVGREEKLVKNKAEGPVAEGGWGLTANDRLPKNDDEIDEDDEEEDKKFYKFFYIDSLYRDSEAIPLDKKTQLLTVDSTARIWYVGKFLNAPGEDEFIFDTNIREVYDKFYNRQPGYEPEEKKTASALSYKPTGNKDSYIQAFYNMIPKMRRGRWYRVMFTSSYGYGATGYSAALESEKAYYEYYMQAMMNSYYYNSSSSYYGSNYYGSYYNSYYNNSSYLNYNDDTGVITEVQPYTPLIFEIYIETGDEDKIKYY